MTYKVIYIDRNHIRTRDYKDKPGDGDGFYTIGFGGIHSRTFKKYNPDIEVECWKADPLADKIYEKVISEVRFIVFPAKQFKWIGVYSNPLRRKIKDEIKNGNIVLFNFSSCKHLLFYQIAPLFKNVPLIVQGHGETTARFDLKIRKGILRKIKALLEIPIENFSFRFVDRYFALDDRIRNWLPKYAENRSQKMVIGVDEVLFHAIDKRIARNMLGLENKKKYILYVGVLAMHKRVDMLINAFNKIKQIYPDVELLIAGNFKTDPLYSLAEKSGAIIYGRVLQNEMYKYLSAADCYVLADLLPIHTFGGIGELPIQALMCNTPIIGGTVRNIPIEIQDKVGIYTRNTEELFCALKKLLSSEIKFFNTRELAVEHYSWQSISMKTRTEYDTLVTCYFNKKNENQ